jgi:septal ring factor EnvC (AmiA/AmiB activator)
MDFEKLLKEKQNALAGIVSRINQLENEKMALAQETFRLEGEIRLLNQLIAPKKEDKNV